MFLDYADPEAFTAEYEELQDLLEDIEPTETERLEMARSLIEVDPALVPDLLKDLIGKPGFELAERLIVLAGYKLLRQEEQKDQPKYARLCRNLMPVLRSIFWAGSWKSLAQGLIDELAMSSTVPLNDLEVNYQVGVDEDGEETYIDEDEYVNLDDVRSQAERQKQWDADAEEVLREVRMLEDQDETYLTLTLANKIIGAENSYIPPTVYVKPSDEPRILEEYATEELCELALKASGAYTRYEEEEPEILDEEGEMTSAPIRQAEEMEMKGTEDLPLLREIMYPYTKAVREHYRRLISYWQKTQREYVEFLRVIASNKKYNDRKEVNSLLNPRNPMEVWFVYHVMESGKTFKGTAWYILHRVLLKGCDDLTLGRPFCNMQQLWLERTRKDMEHSKEIDSFMDKLNDQAQIFAAEDIAYIFLGIHNLLPQEDPDLDDESSQWNTLKIADRVKLTAAWRHITLREFLEFFGDDILENILQQDGGIRITSMDSILKAVKPLEEQIESTYIDNPGAKNFAERTHTKAYFRGLMNGLSADVEDIQSAGEAEWRHETSPIGAEAFSIVYGETKDYKKAWQAFWNCGMVKGIQPTGIKVVSPANGREQFCEWPLAKWKLQNHELMFVSDQRARLKKILADKGWGKQLLAVL